MIKVLIVGPKKSQHIQKWYENSSNLDLKLFTMDPGGNEFKVNVEEFSYFIKNRKLAFFLSIPLFIYTWWRVKPDITNFHYLSSYGLLSLFVPKKKLILNTWGSDVNSYVESKKKWHLFFIKKALKRFSWINAPAEHMKDKLVKLGADVEKIDVYQYGVPNLTSKKDISNKPIKFVSNRNWDELYRVDLIIDAFILLVKEKRIKAELYLYGRGGSIEKKIQGIFDEYPELKSIVIVKGYVEHKKMLEELLVMDVFISIPRIDGMPLSLLEAMEIGLLPIVSHIDANSEWVGERNGIKCEILTASELKLNMLEAYLEIERLSQTGIFKSEWIDMNRILVRDKGNYSKNTHLFLSKINELYRDN